MVHEISSVFLKPCITICLKPCMIMSASQRHKNKTCNVRSQGTAYGKVPLYLRMVRNLVESSFSAAIFFADAW